MMSGEHTLEGDVGFWLEASLSDGGHDASNSIRRQVVVVITNKPTAGFGATNIEAVRACLDGRVGFSSTPPLPFDACMEFLERGVLRYPWASTLRGAKLTASRTARRCAF